MVEMDLIDVLLLRAGYQTTLVMLAVAVFGVMSAVVGTFCIWRQKALIGDAMSHSTLPGICLAFLLLHALGNGEKSFAVLLAGAAVTATISGYGVQWIANKTRLYADTATGIMLSVFFGFGVVLLSIIQTLGNAEQGGLSSFIYGQVATLHLSDAILLAIISIFILSIIAWWFEALIIVSFDEGFASVRGINIHSMDLVVLVCVVLGCVFGLVAIGLLLVLAVMIIPPVTARLWSHDYRRVVFIAAAFGAVACYFGAALSAIAPNYPTGATIVLVSGAFFIISLLIAPVGGLIPQVWRRLRLNNQIKNDHVLRRLFEARENRMGMQLSQLLAGIGGFGPINLLLVHRLRREGYVAEQEGVWTLSDRGVRNIAMLVQGHRLWERYLVTHTTLDSAHVHQSADLVEHVLTPERIKALAAEVGIAEFDQPSVHEIEVQSP